MLDYKFLKIRGALGEAEAEAPARRSVAVNDVDLSAIPAHIIEMIPASVAHENLVVPVDFDGETLTVAAVDADNIAMADKLRFLLAKNVLLVAASRAEVVDAIRRYYERKPGSQISFSCHGCHYPLHFKREMAGKKVACPSCGKVLVVPAVDVSSVDSMLELSDVDLAMAEQNPSSTAHAKLRAARAMKDTLVQFKKGMKALDDPLSDAAHDLSGHRGRPGYDPTAPFGGAGMFFYVVDEGQRVLMRRPDGAMEVIVGPRRVWRGRNSFHTMAHYVAHPDEFLIVRFRDGRQQHRAGPVEIWFDPREHLAITKETALQISAKEAVVVYSQAHESTVISRRVVLGPALFVPHPGEWLHTFSWHASRGGSKGVQKEPNALVFQKLWLMPDQMYHDVSDVRTADDAVLTIRLMIFFELIDIERMLDATHDPIGDFVNAATSDVVAFTSRHDFEQFKRNTNHLNDLETYPQLTGRVAQCGYRINKVVYRGYGAAPALQQMHDQAIEARTRLQLDRATEQQAQDLENYKLDCQLARATKRRAEQVQEVNHDLALAQTRQEADLRQRESQLASDRESRRLESELFLTVRKAQDDQQRHHLEALRALEVDLTAFLTQSRADQVIELRGESRPHVHLDRLGNGKDTEAKRPQ